MIIILYYRILISLADKIPKPNIITNISHPMKVESSFPNTIKRHSKLMYFPQTKSHFSYNIFFNSNAFREYFLNYKYIFLCINMCSKTLSHYFHIQLLFHQLNHIGRQCSYYRYIIIRAGYRLVQVDYCAQPTYCNL